MKLGVSEDLAMIVIPDMISLSILIVAPLPRHRASSHFDVSDQTLQGPVIGLDRLYDTLQHLFILETKSCVGFSYLRKMSE